MDHVAIDLGGRESQICVRNATNDIVLEKRLATARLDEFFRTLPTSRVIVETCAEAFAVAGQAKDAGHDVLRLDNRIRVYNAITDFFKRWLMA